MKPSIIRWVVVVVLVVMLGTITMLIKLYRDRSTVRIIKNILIDVHRPIAVSSNSQYLLTVNGEKLHFFSLFGQLASELKSPIQLQNGDCITDVKYVNNGYVISTLGKNNQLLFYDIKKNYIKTLASVKCSLILPNFNRDAVACFYEDESFNPPMVDVNVVDIKTGNITHIFSCKMGFSHALNSIYYPICWTKDGTGIYLVIERYHKQELVYTDLNGKIQPVACVTEKHLLADKELYKELYGEFYSMQTYGKNVDFVIIFTDEKRNLYTVYCKDKNIIKVLPIDLKQEVNLYGTRLRNIILGTTINGDVIFQKVDYHGSKTTNQLPIYCYNKSKKPVFLTKSAPIVYSYDWIDRRHLPLRLETDQVSQIDGYSINRTVFGILKIK